MCGYREFSFGLDMGLSPLVNSLIEKEDLNKPEQTFPLRLVRCNNCSLVQVQEPIDSEKIYKEQDYLYFSSDMPGLSDYFGEYADDLKNRFLLPSDFVLEIGSNDGVMLNHFRDEYAVLGVDPATNVAIRALADGIPTIPLFFNERLGKQIVKEFGRAKVVYGNNCIAHINDLDSVMKGVVNVLDDEGVFVVECNYWGGMVKNKNYSLVYHDHFSYFSLQNWTDYARKFGLKVFDATVTPAQGGSLRVFLSRGAFLPTERLRILQDEERDSKLNTYQTFLKYKNECLEEAQKLFGVVQDLKAQGKRISAYGAAAKGFSVLQLAGITNEIDYFVDDSPAKQGRYTPINHIPVISRTEAEDKLPDYFFITAPNYARVIIEKEQGFLDKGGKFLLCDSSIVG